MIDTLKLARRLQNEGGMSEKAAEALAEGLNDALRADVATKADLSAAKSELMAAISKAKNEAITWQIGIAFALFGALKLIHS